MNVIRIRATSEILGRDISRMSKWDALVSGNQSLLWCLQSLQKNFRVNELRKKPVA